MNWLAVDTAMNACGVAVRRADGAFFSTIERMERGQSERLMPMIVDICTQAGITLQDVDAYAVASGPGTFTGLRVGLATVRALSQASGKPVYGVGTFDAITAAIPDAPLCILLETKRTDYYVRAPGMDDACLSPDELRAVLQPTWLLAGDALARAQAELGCANETREVASIPLDALINVAERAGTPGMPDPIYLRGADVSVARRKPAQIV